MHFHKCNHAFDTGEMNHSVSAHPYPFSGSSKRVQYRTVHEKNNLMHVHIKASCAPLNYTEATLHENRAAVVKIEFLDVMQQG